jgi:4-amino-4-deoxy-L-arabinose transferase-like glycosyltransferase
VRDDDDLPPKRERKPIPLLLWFGLGVLLVILFAIAVGVLKPPAVGV